MSWHAEPAQRWFDSSVVPHQSRTTTRRTAALSPCESLKK